MDNGVLAPVRKVDVTELALEILAVILRYTVYSLMMQCHTFSHGVSFTAQHGPCRWTASVLGLEITTCEVTFL